MKEFFDHQLSKWPEARQRYEDLKGVQTRDLAAGNIVLRAQWNPARMVSTGAKTDKVSLAQRPCFLCAENRPKEQTAIDFRTEECRNKETLESANREGHPEERQDTYELLVNPYPIMPMHFTIPLKAHEPQSIGRHYHAIHQLTERCGDLTVFYNGPKCGASAPDHMHFQAGTTGILPLQQQWKELSRMLKPAATLADGSTLALLEGWAAPAFVIKSTARESDQELFLLLYNALKRCSHAGHDGTYGEDGEEPMMNILAWREGKELTTVVFPRRRHRPSCYFADEGKRLLVSPGALDMAGLLITPRREDFENMTAEDAAGILRECALSEEEMRDLRIDY